MVEIPRWCSECLHHVPRDGKPSLCGLRKCTMKPDFHKEGIDDSITIARDCGGIQGWRGKRLPDELGEVHEREARAAESAAMTKPKRKRAATKTGGNRPDIPVIKGTIPEPVLKRVIPAVPHQCFNGRKDPAKPTAAQVEKAKACQHLHQAEFLDDSFTGLGIMCKDCQLLIRWITKPDWLDKPESAQSQPKPKPSTLEEFL